MVYSEIEGLFKFSSDIHIPAWSAIRLLGFAQTGEAAAAAAAGAEEKKQQPWFSSTYSRIAPVCALLSVSVCGLDPTLK